MRKSFYRGVLIAAAWLVPSVARAIPISGSGLLGSFAGTFDYTPSGETSGIVSVSLTNTSPAANGGFITSFVFNIPAGATVVSSSLASSDADFGQLGGPSFVDAVTGSPFGHFDIGSSTGGSFEGGGTPNVGIGVGSSATFSFTLSGDGLGSLTPEYFLATLSVPPGAGEGLQDFVVRFRGFDDGGSDKVYNAEIPVPEPATALLLSLGLASLSAARRRSRR